MKNKRLVCIGLVFLCILAESRIQAQQIKVSEEIETIQNAIDSQGANWQGA